MKQLLIFYFILSSFSTSASTLQLRGDYWCPFNCHNDDRPGYMVEAAQKIFVEHNIKVEYRTTSWPRAISAVEKGSIDAIVGASMDDCPTCIFPSVSQGIPKQAFYVKKGNSWRYKGTDSLKDIRLGAIAGYTYSKEVDEYIKGHHGIKNGQVQLSNANSALKSNIEKLLNNRIDVLIEEESVFNYFIESSNYTESFQFAGYVGKPRPKEWLHVAFSPKVSKAKEWVQIFNQGWHTLRDNGELKKILSKYGLNETVLP